MASSSPRPALGRFLSPDPLSAPYEPQNLSAYSYSDNDPINTGDPSGLRKAECEGGWEECGPGNITSGGSDTGGGNGSTTGSGAASPSPGRAPTPGPYSGNANDPVAAAIKFIWEN
ncbi:hypothetical protein CTU88_27180 [Streptomyces sp. JV178]|uniref:RHS repeat-associated core domain-containing protein n=1 Tax=Streptomyces sp. JV178 TaxID=858632 RepID=UPI000C1B109E|nr:RHS repeat-associated core domain-containing protein [Streptomyces sp. JV178]PIM69660.1 hypothetical protein CTU88_27180 [Streptomyces sp. JV178]